MLLYYKIEPWSKPTYDLKTLTEDENMLALLKKARQVKFLKKY